MECIVLEGGDDVQLEPGEVVTLVRVEGGGASLRVRTTDAHLTEGTLPATFLRKKTTSNGVDMEGVCVYFFIVCSTVEPLNNGHVGDECFVHYSEVVPSSEVLTCIQLSAGGTQFVHFREVFRVSTTGGSTVPSVLDV